MTIRIALAAVGCIAAIAPVASASAGPKPLMIPVAFRGEWDETLAGCRMRADDGHVSITARRITFYAGEGVLKGISASTPRSVTLRLAYSSGGETVDSTETLTLSRSGRVLTITTPDGTHIKRRCPAEKKT